ncbi:MAG: hypothetical protein EBZ59_06730 [Planctomycetia bacterium]|nr:hypothetical protein [Planctomycetia bacterium]
MEPAAVSTAPASALRNVFVYWRGRDYKLIILLRRLMELHADQGRNYALHVLDPGSLRKWCDDVPPEFPSLPPAFQADVARVLLVCRHGGVWLDSDTIVMDDLGRLFALLEAGEGFFVTEERVRVCNGIFGSRPGTPLMNRWRDYVLQVVRERGKDIRWGELGFMFLGKAAEEGWLSGYTMLDGLETVYPVDWQQCATQFLLRPPETWQEHVREFQPAVVLVNSVYKLVDPLPASELLGSRFPLNRFLDASLERARRYGPVPTLESMLPPE